MHDGKEGGNRSNLCSRDLTSTVVDWRVSKEPSLSDHRLITFRLANVKPEVRMARNPKNTDWDVKNIKDFPRKYGTNKELELSAEHLRGALITSYERNCPT